MCAPIVQIILPGPPVPKGRPRFRVIKPKGKAGFVSTYSDPKTAKYEAALKAAGERAMGDREPLGEALSVQVDVCLPIPPSWPRRDRDAALAGTKLPVTGGDADNYGKVIDGLNKTVWRDDAQIVCLSVQKMYSATPLLRVSVWKFHDDGRLI